MGFQSNGTFIGLLGFREKGSSEQMAWNLDKQVLKLKIWQSSLVCTLTSAHKSRS